MPSRKRRPHIAGTIPSSAIKGDPTLAIDVLVVRGHTRRGATLRVAHLFSEKDLPP